MSRLWPPSREDSTVLAVPGYCVAGQTTGRPISGFKVHWEDKPDEADRVARWSAESVRHFLSSPAAVGTVDQALLGGLQVKWAHLRGAALSRSLLVVDEVHASDAYMTELLRTLLDGHLALGGHALLMSATLGATARIAFTDGGARSPELPEPKTAAGVPYPSLTLAGNGKTRTQSIHRTGSPKTVAMEVRSWLSEPALIAQEGREAAAGGAKVLVIRNTVASAQAVFNELVGQEGGEWVLTVNGTPTLHHSRFAAEDRKLLDDAVEAALGKERTPGGRIVIGTQTLEQSLDIDADILITDICPVDVLLQRIGRLHRHTRERPGNFARPRYIVLAPQGGLESGLDGSLMRHGLGQRPGLASGGIYRNLLGVEQTRRSIVEDPVWEIPDMNRMLVELGTNPVALLDLAKRLGGAWMEHEQQTWGVTAAEEQTARQHLLDRSKPFEDLAFADLDETVRTRLGEDGPRVKLAEDVVGPFGRPVQTFNLPAHLFGGTESMPTRDEIEDARLTPTMGGGPLQVGSHVFLYDRTGIRRKGTYLPN